MDKPSIKKRIENLRRDLEQHNYKYYVLNKPVISDFEYDQLLKELEKLETDTSMNARKETTNAISNTINNLIQRIPFRLNNDNQINQLDS